MTRLVTQTREQRFLEVFQKVTKLISMVLDHQQVMDTIVHSLPELLDVDACTIRLLDRSTNTFVLGAAHGLSMEYLSRQAIDTEETMEMIKSGYPVAKTDIDKDRSYQHHEMVSREGIKSVLALPILFQDSIIGIMRLLTRTNRIFSAEEISFAMALAEQVGIAISNGRMFKEMENQVDFMQEVQEITKLVNSTLDLDTVLNTIVERLPRSMGARGCTIRLLNPQTNHLDLVASHGVSREYLERGLVETEKNVLMVLSGEPVAIYDVTHDPRVRYGEEMEREGIRSLLAVPVKVGNEVIGVLRILSDEHRFFTSSELNFVMTVAESGGTAIQNARTYQKINRLFSHIEENERFLSDILDCIRPRLLVVGRDKHIVLANRVFLEAIGKSESEVLGAEYHEFCPLEDGEGQCPVDQVLETGKSAVCTHEVELADGMHWFERTASPMFGEDGLVEFVIEVSRDITTQRHLEAEKMARVKLEGVVEMAGTVAHEINSPLFAALGTAELLQEDIGDADLKEEVRTIIRNLREISKLTQKMTGMTGFSSREYVGETRIVELK